MPLPSGIFLARCPWTTLRATIANSLITIGSSLMKQRAVCEIKVSVRMTFILLHSVLFVRTLGRNFFSGFNTSKSHSPKHLDCFYLADRPILALSRTNMLFKIPGGKEVRGRSGCLLCSELATFIHYLPRPH